MKLTRHVALSVDHPEALAQTTHIALDDYGHVLDEDGALLVDLMTGIATLSALGDTDFVRTRTTVILKSFRDGRKSPPRLLGPWPSDTLSSGVSAKFLSLVGRSVYVTSGGQQFLDEVRQQAGYAPLSDTSGIHIWDIDR